MSVMSVWRRARESSDGEPEVSEAKTTSFYLTVKHGLLDARKVK